MNITKSLYSSTNKVRKFRDISSVTVVLCFEHARPNVRDLCFKGMYWFGFAVVIPI